MFNIITISTVIVLFVSMIVLFSVSLAIVTGNTDKVRKIFSFIDKF